MCADRSRGVRRHRLAGREAGLEQIARLYAVEKKIRGEPPATRQAIRWDESAPLVNRFGVWLDEQRSRVSRARAWARSSLHRQPVAGIARLPLRRAVEIDSNAVENLMRPVKLSARNALFAGHDEGAQRGRASPRCSRPVGSIAWSRTLAQEHAWRTIAAGHPQARVRELLPWNFDPASN